MSKTNSRIHTSWKPKVNDKPVIKRIREHTRHTVKRRLRLSVSLHELERLDNII